MVPVYYAPTILPLNQVTQNLQNPPMQFRGFQLAPPHPSKPSGDIENKDRDNGNHSNGKIEPKAKPETLVKPTNPASERVGETISVKVPKVNF